MIVIASKYLVPKGYAAIAVYPFILVRDNRLKQHNRLLNHERIHLRQQAELLVIPFFIIYITEYIIRFIKYRNHHTAYKHISFEREAYSNENNIYYLTNRPLWNFIRFF